MNHYKELRNSLPKCIEMKLNQNIAHEGSSYLMVTKACHLEEEMRGDECAECVLTKGQSAKMQ